MFQTWIEGCDLVINRIGLYLKNERFSEFVFINDLKGGEGDGERHFYMLGIYTCFSPPKASKGHISVSPFFYVKSFSECLGIGFSFIGFKEILEKKHTISLFY